MFATQDKFRVSTVTERIHRIAERDPYGQTPFMYLIFANKDYGVLIDTGCGSGDLVQFMEQRCGLGTPKLPKLLVINTHNHFDHVGCNYLFSSPEGKADYCISKFSELLLRRRLNCNC